MNLSAMLSLHCAASLSVFPPCKHLYLFGSRAGSPGPESANSFLLSRSPIRSSWALFLFPCYGWSAEPGSWCHVLSLWHWKEKDRTLFSEHGKKKNTVHSLLKEQLLLSFMVKRCILLNQWAVFYSIYTKCCPLQKSFGTAMKTRRHHVKTHIQISILITSLSPFFAGGRWSLWGKVGVWGERQLMSALVISNDCSILSGRASSGGHDSHLY